MTSSNHLCNCDLTIPTVNRDYQFSIHREIAADKDVQENTEASGAIISINCHFNLPSCLTEDYRIRHQLSYHDLALEIYTKCTAKQLWFAAAQQNIDIPSIATFISSKDKSHGIFRNATLVASKLIQKLDAIPDQLSKQDRLICPYDTFQPKLPVHFITAEQLVILPNLNSKPIYYTQVWTWRNITCLPIYYHHGYVLMTRVLPKFVYQRIYGYPENALALPFEHLINGQVFCETDERFLVQICESHNQLVEFAKRSKEYFLQFYQNDLFTAEKHLANKRQLGWHEEEQIQRTDSNIDQPMAIGDAQDGPETQALLVPEAQGSDVALLSMNKIQKPRKLGTPGKRRQKIRSLASGNIGFV